jgi:CDP-glycerol glycerophosphotransferase (TagB/SpsB family)
MVSDFSGIIFDYMFLRDKPVLYVNQNFDLRPYDADDLDHELWQFKIMKEAGIELREDDFPRITEIIKNAKDSEPLAAARRKARETAWQYPGESGRRVFDFMTGVNNA